MCLCVQWDAGVEAMYAHERKVGVLEALEATWRAAHEVPDAEAGYYATSYSSWLSYGTGLLANIVENLQLTLSDVHLRYEDAVTCAPSAFAAGLTVESLVADSCDASWRRGFTLLRDPDGCSFKLLELNQLALYWDSMQVPGGMFADCHLADLTVRYSRRGIASFGRPTSRLTRYLFAGANERDVEGFPPIHPAGGGGAGARASRAHRAAAALAHEAPSRRSSHYRLRTPHPHFRK